MRRRGLGSTLSWLALLGSGLSGPFLAGCSQKPAVVDTSAAAEMSYGAQMARQGFWREAVFRFEKAAAQKPEDPRVQNNLAVAYEAVGETAKALTAYRKAVELAPDDPKIKRNYARFAEYYTAIQRAVGPAPAPPR